MDLAAIQIMLHFLVFLFAHFDQVALQGVPSHSTRRALFERYVRTRAEEERKEKRAAQKAALDAFKQLLEEAIEVSPCLPSPLPYPIKKMYWIIWQFFFECF